MNISKMERKIQEMLLVFYIIAFDVVPADSKYKKENTCDRQSMFQYEKFSANNFALSDAEDNTFGPLNRGGVVDLPLLRTLLAIRQKSREPSLWEVMEFFFLFY